MPSQHRPCFDSAGGQPDIGINQTGIHAPHPYRVHSGLYANARVPPMGRRISISVSSDEIALIRSNLASVGVQLADLKAAMEAQQARVRAALLDVGE